jgi:hypothetical protein
MYTGNGRDTQDCIVSMNVPDHETVKTECFRIPPCSQIGDVTRMALVVLGALGGAALGGFGGLALGGLTGAAIGGLAGAAVGGAAGIALSYPWYYYPWHYHPYWSPYFQPYQYYPTMTPYMYPRYPMQWFPTPAFGYW